MMFPSFLVKITLPLLGSFFILIFLSYLQNTRTPFWVMRKIAHSLGLLLIILSGFYLTYPFEFWVAFLLALLVYGFLSLLPSVRFFHWFTRIITRNPASTNERKKAIIAFFFALFSLGTCYFLSLWLFSSPSLFLLASLPLAFGDPFGEVIGRYWGTHPVKYNPHKTIQGSMGVVLGTFFILLLSFLFLPLDLPINTKQIILYSAILAIMTGTIESFLNDYLDNLFIPYSNFLVLLILLNTPLI